MVYLLFGSLFHVMIVRECPFIGNVKKSMLGVRPRHYLMLVDCTTSGSNKKAKRGPQHVVSYMEREIM